MYREIRYRPRLEERLEAVYKERIERRAGSTRKEQVLMAQLRAGHCPRTRYMYYEHRIGWRDDAKCEKCGEEESKDHWLECKSVADAWMECCGELWRSGKDECCSFSSNNSKYVCSSVVGHLRNEDLVGRFLRRTHPEWQE